MIYPIYIYQLTGNVVCSVVSIPEIVVYISCIDGFGVLDGSVVIIENDVIAVIANSLKSPLNSQLVDGIGAQTLNLSSTNNNRKELTS